MKFESAQTALDMVRATDESEAEQLDNEHSLRINGWEKRGQSFFGEYLCPSGSYPGVIERNGQLFDVRIKDAPAAVRRILNAKDEDCGWASFQAHHQTRGNTIWAVIGFVEDVLRDCWAIAQMDRKGSAQTFAVIKIMRSKKRMSFVPNPEIHSLSTVMDSLKANKTHWQTFKATIFEQTLRFFCCVKNLLDEEKQTLQK